MRCIATQGKPDQGETGTYNPSSLVENSVTHHPVIMVSGSQGQSHRQTQGTVQPCEYTNNCLTTTYAAISCPISDFAHHQLTQPCPQLYVIKSSEAGFR